MQTSGGPRGCRAQTEEAQRRGHLRHVHAGGCCAVRPIYYIFDHDGWFSSASRSLFVGVATLDPEELSEVSPNRGVPLAPRGCIALSPSFDGAVHPIAKKTSREPDRTLTWRPCKPSKRRYPAAFLSSTEAMQKDAMRPIEMSHSGCSSSRSSRCPREEHSASNMPCKPRRRALPKTAHGRCAMG